MLNGHFSLSDLCIDNMSRKMLKLHISLLWISFFQTWQYKLPDYMSHLVRKPTICIGENKGADQLRSNCEADQRLCFHYTDSTVPLLLKSEISSF